MFHKRLFSLDPRLSACAALVREGRPLADIGTDHGYLPIYLVKTGKIPKAIAADVNLGPLQKAQHHIAKYGVADKVQARLSNGLEVIFPNEADDIVIAGMGGQLMIELIESTPWLKNPEKHLILQPMTGATELRQYLKVSGFFVAKEIAAIADGKVYSAMLAYYAPEEQNDDVLFPYLGLLRKETPESREYVARQIRYYSKKLEGLRHAQQTAEVDAVESLLHRMEAIVQEELP